MDETALTDILYGSIILAAGGGGPVQSGKSLVRSMALSHIRPKLIPFESIPNSSKVAVPIAMGSCATLLENFLDFQMIKALKIFEEQVGKVDALLPVETGQVNTLAVLYTGAKTTIPVIDADGTGRSIPEFKNTVFYSARVDPNPFVMYDSAGNFVVLHASKIDEVDRLGRTICTEMGGLCGVCGIQISGEEIKRIAVPNTISNCLRLGKVLRENRGSRVVEALVKCTDGFLLTKGRIAKIESKVAHGHDYGMMEVKGLASYKGKDVSIAFKNEGLIAYLNGKPAVISPDHIFMIDLLTSEPVTFTDVVPDLLVAVIALKANPKRRTKLDYDGFRDSLRDVGYVGEYVPVEDLLNRS